MAAFLRYLARLCCDPDEDQEEAQFRQQRGSLVGEPSAASIVVESTLMSRPSVMTLSSSTSGGTTHNYQPILAAGSSSPQVSDPNERHDGELDNEDDGDGEDCCCRGKSSSAQQNDLGLHEFFRKIRERWRRYDSMETFRPIAQGSAKENYKAGLSPLRTASTYDASKDIPTISLDEVVLPGSELQKQMARAMSLNLEKQDDECVICMEGFDPTNPRMPTQCGCGRNKTYFHLPCLYQWIEQSEECPSCRQKLRWEEF